MADKMMGRSINMVRCYRDVKGLPCPGMIEIPVGDKGVCPKCGRVTGLGEYYAERGRITVKDPVRGLDKWR